LKTSTACHAAQVLPFVGMACRHIPVAGFLPHRWPVLCWSLSVPCPSVVAPTWAPLTFGRSLFLALPPQFPLTPGMRACCRLCEPQEAGF